MTDEEHLVAGRYRLVRRIGTGAMGVVWQGHDERLNRPVAVKKLLLHPGLPPAKTAEAVARCMREGRIAARLHHANAITVFDVVDEDGMPCLVMEFLQSRSMATVIAEDGPLPPSEVADIGTQVAEALAAAHAAGIVHRDITPGNILLGENGSVKITDFGISRAADDVAVTKTGLFAGTPAYLAPEVALGGSPTSASDVFSLGSALYTAVEGEPPFGRAANALGVLHAVAGGKINPPKRSCPLTDVVIALLAPDPQNRPTAAQARDLLAAAHRAEVSEHAPLPVIAAAPAGAEPVDDGIADQTELVDPRPAPTNRSRGHLVLAGAFVLALAAVGIWLLGGRNGLAPAVERGPADGTVHNQTPLTSVSGPVAPVPVGETEKIGETPGTDTSRGSGTATTTAANELNPPTTTATTPPTTTVTTMPPTTSNNEETTPETTASTPANVD